MHPTASRQPRQLLRGSRQQEPTGPRYSHERNLATQPPLTPGRLTYLELKELPLNFLPDTQIRGPNLRDQLQAGFCFNVSVVVYAANPENLRNEKRDVDIDITLAGMSHALTKGLHLGNNTSKRCGGSQDRDNIQGGVRLHVRRRRY